MLHKIWQPAFHPESLAGYSTLMWEATEKLTQRLRHLSTRGEAVDIWREIGSLTMEIVGTSAFG